MREAFWISVAVHLFAIIFLAMSPKIFGFKAIQLASPEDIMSNKQLTYLDMPPDMQKPPPKVRPDAKLSDKNRIAESRHPSIDQKTLEELRKARPPPSRRAAGAACRVGAVAAGTRRRSRAAGAEHSPGAGPHSRCRSKPTRSRPSISAA